MRTQLEDTVPVVVVEPVVVPVLVPVLVVPVEPVPPVDAAPEAPSPPLQPTSVRPPRLPSTARRLHALCRIWRCSHSPSVGRSGSVRRMISPTPPAARGAAAADLRAG